MKIIIKAIAITAFAVLAFGVEANAQTIQGAGTVCSGTAYTYSIQALASSYSWGVTGGTINGSSSGSSVSVTWNSSGGTKKVSVNYYQLGGFGGGGSWQYREKTVSLYAAGTVSSSATVCQGASGSVNITGNTDGVAKWQKQTWNGSSWGSWTDISNTSTHQSYSNIQSSTRYRVVTSNCSLTTNYVTITVNPTTAGGSISGGGTYCNSASGSLTLTGYTGSILKWQKSTNGGSSWTDISNTSTTQSISGVTTTTVYRAQVKSGVCSSAYSSTKTVTIDALSVGGSASGGGNFCGSGSGTATLSGHTGTVLKWEKRVNGGSWQNIGNAGSTSVSYSGIVADTDYRAVVQSGSCGVAWSNLTSVNIDANTVGGSVSGGGTFCGTTSRTMTLSGHTGSVVKWQKSLNEGLTWSDISHTSTTYSASNTSQTTSYRVLVENGVCSSQYSSVAHIFIDTSTVGGSISGGQTNACGNASGTLTLSGYTGTIQKWQKQTNGGSWTDISGSAGDTTIPYNHGEGTYNYKAEIVSPYGVCSTSWPSATVSVIPASDGGTAKVNVGGTNYASKDVCLGTTGTLLLEGSVGTIVRWEYRYNNGSGWNSWSTHTGITADPDYDTEYKALVQYSSCATDWSTVASLDVDLSSQAGSIGGHGDFCVTGSGTLTLSGQRGSVVRWQKSTNGGSSWSDAGTAATLPYSGVTVDTQYKAEVQNGVCASAWTSPVTVNIDPQTVGGTVSGGTTGCTTVTTTLNLSGHTGSVVHWEYSINGGSSWTTDSGQTGTSYPATGVDTTTKYRALVDSGVCNSAYSSEATITIDDVSDAGSITGGGTFCDSASGTLTVSGYNGTIEAWESDEGGSYADVTSSAGQTSINYSHTTKGTVRYRVRVKNGTCSAVVTSPVESVKVDKSEAGDISYSGTNNVCGTASGTVSFSNHDGTINEIQVSEDNISFLPYYTMPGGNTSGPVSVTQGTKYFRGKVTYGSCLPDYTSSVSVTGYGISDAGTIAAATGTEILFLGSGTGTLEQTDINTNGDFQWQQSEDSGTTWTDISAATGSTYAFSVDTTTMFRIEAQIQSCAVAYSNEVTVEVRYTGHIELPLSTVAYGQEVTMEVTNLVGEVLEWEVSFDGGTTYEILDPNYRKILAPKEYDFTILEDTTLFRAQVAVDDFGNYYSDVLTVVMNQAATPQTDWDQVKQTAVLAAVSTEGQIPTTSSDTTVVTQVFADGLGRHLQSLTLSASPDENDITQISVYDKYGRQSKGYMAYTRSGAINNKIDIDDLLAEQSAFYDNNLDDITDSDVPFSEVVYDDSPLQRIEESGAPGDTWKIGGGHTVKYAYRTDTINEVRQWSEAGVSTGYYPADELWVSQITDENGNKALSFTDKSGRTIQQKRQIDATEWATTAHIYDALGRMKYTISPEGMNNVAASGTVTLTAAFIDDWVFEYTYDDLGRVTEKKVPGAEAQYFVYDKLDRIVLTQDGNMRDDDQWTYIKYDELHRPIMTGLYTNATTTTLSGMQALLDAETVHNESDSTANHGYTNRAFPDSGTEVLTVSYYDDYDFDNNGTDDYSYINEGVTPEPIPFTRTRGLATGGKVKILETSTWLESAVFYDKYGRGIQAQAENHYGGTDKVTTQFDFAGRALKSWQHHHTATDTIRIINRFVYDHVGRVLEQYQTFEDESELLLASYEYNDLGQMIDKKLHSEDNGTTFEQSLDLTYNIRGWVTGINDAALSGSDGDLWGMELAYDEAVTGVTTTKMYNGNISAVKWSTGQETTSERAYAYSYDKMNRFTEAQHYAKETSWSSKDDFSVDNLAYDHNGNIEALRRRHWDGSTMDSLTYTYDGNKLLTVADGALNIGFNDGNTSGDDYLYDANGNMTEDKNKGLDSIQYNFMNLPVKVVKSDSSYQKYTYSAAGGKLVVESYNKSDSLLARTDYLGAFIYKDSVLQSIEHSEGRIISGITAGTWEHQYHIKDHQGNNRLTFTTAPNTFEYLATMETSRSTLEESYFSNIDDTGVSVASYINHTPTSIVPSPSRAIRINNAIDNPQKVIGAAIPLQVFPGDTIKAEVFAKYQNYTSTNDDAIGTMAAFMESAFGLPSVNGETQDIFDFMEGAPFLGLAAWNDLDETVPRAYLNYILMDKNFNFVDFGFEQVSSSAEIPGSNPSSHSHEKLSFDLPITEEGYIYLYVSNESQNNADVYFDDFKVTHVESKMVQTNDFYPFGLAAESFSRLSNIPNKFLFNQSSELNESTGNYEMPYRHYDPVLGRMNAIDILASEFPDWTPYQFAYDNPIMYSDPSGAVNSANDTMAAIINFIRSAFDSMDGGKGSGGGSTGNTGNGGTWTAGGGVTWFGSQSQAMSWAVENLGSGFDFVEGGLDGAVSRFRGTPGNRHYGRGFKNSGRYNGNGKKYSVKIKGISSSNRNDGVGEVYGSDDQNGDVNGLFQAIVSALGAIADYNAESWVISGLDDRKFRSNTGTPYTKVKDGEIKGRLFIGSVNASDIFDTSQLTYGRLRDPNTRVPVNLYFDPSNSGSVTLSDVEKINIQAGYPGEGFKNGHAVVITAASFHTLFATFDDQLDRDAFYEQHYDKRLERRKNWFIKKFQLTGF